MTDPRGFVDEQRAVLRVTGAEARDWLQSLLSNDLARLSPESPLYAALLSPQGKYLFDMIVVERDGDILLDVDAARAPALLKRLSMYRLRRKVELTPAPELRVALIWGAGTPPPGALADPRDPALGWRIYAESPDLSGVAPASPADYDALRVARATPQSGVELIPEDSYLLEMGFDRLNGVDFRKGCYIGQEVTARMRHKTELRKGLARVAVEGQAPAPGAPITAADGKQAGALYTVAGGEGLAYLRFDRAGGEMRAGEARLRRLPD